MTDRERLLDILNKPVFPHELVDPLEAVADYLLDNGVTFEKDIDVPSKWIPVSEPPKKHGKYLAACENIAIPQIRLFEGEWDSIQKVTHWMLLPEPPKEVKHDSDLQED